MDRNREDLVATLIILVMLLTTLVIGIVVGHFTAV